jgi:hypothetical protein
MNSSVVEAAPWWRRMLAGGVDAAIGGFVVWLARKQSLGANARATRWAPLLGPTSELLREQLGSPGQRLLGLRTVDRRTGRRVELWRTLALLGSRLGARLLMRRLAPAPLTPPQERDRREFLDELNALHERHREDPDALQAERRRLFERQQPVTSTLLGVAGPALAAGLLNNRLRRRLAPTTEALIRRADSQSP